jgi:hypothetical protein
MMRSHPSKFQDLENFFLAHLPMGKGVQDKNEKPLTSSFVSFRENHYTVKFFSIQVYKTVAIPHIFWQIHIRLCSLIRSGSFWFRTWILPTVLYFTSC